MTPTRMPHTRTQAASLPVHLPALLLALGLAAPALPQERPLGAAPAAEAASARTGFGECPRDLLRDSWLKIMPQQMAAVEQEVLKLCTERAEAIATYNAAEARFQTSLNLLTAPAPAEPPAPDPTPTDRVARLGLEVRDLRARIAKLEGDPEQPETQATLEQLHADLAAKEAELARAEGEDTGQRDDEVAAPLRQTDANIDQTAAQTTSPDPDEGTDETHADGSAREDRIPSRPGLPDPSVTDAPAPDRTPASPGSPVDPVIAAPLPPDGETTWAVIHAVRLGDGPWKVQLQGSRDIAIRVPAATPEDPPTIRWQSVSDPPVTVTLGDTLPDGLVLKDVTEAGVVLAPDRGLIGALSGFAVGNAEPLLIPFAEDPSPGDLEWAVSKITEDGS